MLHNQNIVILGSRSYIGRYLCVFLENKVKKVIHSFSENCDLTNPNSVKSFFNSLVEEKYTVIFLAVINRPGGDCFEGFEKNNQMMKNFVEAVAPAKIDSILYFSSVDVYGKSSTIPIDETTAVAPDNWYGLAKMNCEWILNYTLGREIPIMILRIPGVYGTFPGENSIINKFISLARDQKSITLFGNGSTLRDYLYLEDLANIVEQLLSYHENKLLNIVSGKSYTILNILDIIRRHIQIPFEIVYKDPPVKHRSFDLAFDISQLRKVLPSFRFTELEKGIQAY